MATGLVYDDQFLDHAAPRGHPERPDRLRAIAERLRNDGLWDRCTHIKPRPIDMQWVLACHEDAYIDRLRKACKRGDEVIDTADCPICPETFKIARLAAGGVLKAADAVMAGKVTNAFCAIRPPGHHAERNLAMGFCYLSNVAIAANYLIAHHGLGRIAIVDFDVHHGNGTQHIHEARKDVLFISLHEHPAYLYPGTGYPHEIGVGEGEGYTLNLPIEPPAGDDEYKALFDTYVIPKVEGFNPQMVLVSAGFDAAAADPIAHMEVSTEGFRWMTQQLVNVANARCEGRLLSCLEGGYDLTALADGVAAHVGVLLGDE